MSAHVWNFSVSQLCISTLRPISITETCDRTCRCLATLDVANPSHVQVGKVTRSSGLRSQQKQRAAVQPESHGAMTSLLCALLVSHPDATSALESPLPAAVARLQTHRAAASSPLPHSFVSADDDDAMAPRTSAAALETAAAALNTVAEGPADYWEVDIALQLAVVIIQVPAVPGVTVC